MLVNHARKFGKHERLSYFSLDANEMRERKARWNPRRKSTKEKCGGGKFKIKLITCRSAPIGRSKENAVSSRCDQFVETIALLTNLFTQMMGGGLYIYFQQ